MTTKRANLKPIRRGPSTGSRRPSATAKVRPRRASTARLAALPRFEASQHLDSDVTVAEFIDAALETGEPAVLIRALGEVARARGMARVDRVRPVHMLRPCVPPPPVPRSGP